MTSLSTAIFEPAARPAPVRATRRTRLAEIQATAQPAVDATDAATEAHAALRSSRRTIAVAVPAAPQPCAEAVAVVQPKTPILRTRRTRLRLLTEEAAAAAELSVEPAPVAEASLPAPVEDAQPSLVRPLPAFRPAPAVTQEELNRLTQRNTKKNQVAFNRIKLETVFLDYARPPSPTSKIRRAFGSEGSLGSSTTKEGREARAAKRRNALRSSADGSELAALAEELKAEPVSLTETEPLKQHFRAAGDDEQYFTPQRTGGALKSAAAGRGRSPGSNPSSASASPRRREPKRVKWDRALVYEGPLDGDSCSSGDGILKVSLPRTSLHGQPADPRSDRSPSTSTSGATRLPSPASASPRRSPSACAFSRTSSRTSLRLSLSIPFVHTILFCPPLVFVGECVKSAGTV